MEELPFEDEEFDVATAYSFLDHLEKPEDMLVEASRVLKPGGCLYIDLVPNFYYWEALSQNRHLDQVDVSQFVSREHLMVTANDQKVEQQYGIDAAVFRKAEPSKELGGIDPFAFRQLALKNGFKSCEIHFDWFLGNAKVLHQQGFEHEKIVMEYLQESLPISKGMFKYVWFVLYKEAVS